MKLLILLIKAHLTGSSALSRGRRAELKTQRQRWLIPVAVIGIGMAMVSLGSMEVSIYRSLYTVGEMFGYGEITILFALAASWVFMFIFSFIYGISILFQANDLRLLIPLPVGSTLLVSSRLAVVYLYMMVWNLLILLPALIVQGFMAGVTIWYVIYAILLLLVSPVVPVLLSALLGTLLVRTTGTFRHKTLYEVAVMLTSLAAIIGLQSVLTRMSVDPDASLQVIYTFIDGRLESIYHRLPLFAITAEGAFTSGWLKGLLGMLIMASSGAVLLLVISFRYRAILSNQASTAAYSRKRGRSPAHGTPGRHRGIYRSLMRKEFDVIASNSTFLMETVMQVFILPFLLVIFYVTGQLGEVSQFLDMIRDLPYLELAVFGILLLFEGLTSVSSTSISREGKRFVISRLLPVGVRTHVYAKILFQYAIFFPVYLLYIIGIYLILPLDLAALVFIIPGGLVSVAPCVMLGLYIDLRRPLLQWSHPQQAMKQNLNVLFSMGVNIAYLALLAGIAALGLLAGLPIVIIGLSLLVVSGVVVILLRGRLLEAAETCYNPA